LPKRGFQSKSHKFTEPEVLKLAKQAYGNNPAFEFKPEKSALLVIDMQDEFVKPHWTPFWVPEATHQVPRIKQLLEFCRKNGIPVIFTVFAKTNNYFDRPLTGKFMSNRYAELGSTDPSWFRNGNIWHEIAALQGEIVIQKPSYGAFYDTPLETILKNLEKDTVIICGTLTNFCCGTTARQAYERGFKVVIGSDVTSTDDPTLHQAELKTLRKGFAMVLSTNEIIERLIAENNRA
jgi:nicotinamidase-related amidase